MGMMGLGRKGVVSLALAIVGYAIDDDGNPRGEGLDVGCGDALKDYSALPIGKGPLPPLGLIDGDYPDPIVSFSIPIRAPVHVINDVGAAIFRSPGGVARGFSG